MARPGLTPGRCSSLPTTFVWPSRSIRTRAHCHTPASGRSALFEESANQVTVCTVSQRVEIDVATVRRLDGAEGQGDAKRCVGAVFPGEGASIGSSGLSGKARYWNSSSLPLIQVSGSAPPFGVMPHPRRRAPSRMVADDVERAEAILGSWSFLNCFLDVLVLLDLDRIGQDAACVAQIVRPAPPEPLCLEDRVRYDRRR